MTVTKTDVATWMVEEVRSQGFLYQEYAAGEIESRFGSEFVYLNENGNLAISPAVLREFRKLKPDDVEWNNSDKSWS